MSKAKVARFEELKSALADAEQDLADAYDEVERLNRDTISMEREVRALAKELGLVYGDAEDNEDDSCFCGCGGHGSCKKDEAAMEQECSDMAEGAKIVQQHRVALRNGIN